MENHEVEDKHLHRWIKIILNTIDPNAPSTTATQGAGASDAQSSEREFQAIVAELKSTDTF